jgi:hypothetical protein
MTCKQLAKLDYCTHDDGGIASDVQKKCPIACCLCFPLSGSEALESDLKRSTTNWIAKPSVIASTLAVIMMLN